MVHVAYLFDMKPSLPRPVISLVEKLAFRKMPRDDKY